MGCEHLSGASRSTRYWPGSAGGRGKPSTAASTIDVISLVSRWTDATRSLRKPFHAGGDEMNGVNPAFPLWTPFLSALSNSSREAFHPGLSAGIDVAIAMRLGS